jgi:hypothetical protein
MTQCHRTRVGKLHVILLQTSLLRSRRPRRDLSARSKLSIQSARPSRTSYSPSSVFGGDIHEGKNFLQQCTGSLSLVIHAAMGALEIIRARLSTPPEVQQFSSYSDAERSAAWLSRRSHAYSTSRLGTTRKRSRQN